MDITPGDDNEANKLNLSNSDDASTEDSTSNDATNVNGNNEGPLIIESHKKKPVDDEIENQKENNGDGLVIVDISQRIAKVDTDDSESADDLLNDAVFSKGRKRKASEMRSDDEMDGIKTADSTLDSSIVEQVDKDESMMDDSDLGGLPPKQTLGKGKRARIPNKRYSDILLSPNRNNGSSDSFASEFKDELGAASAATPPTSTMYNYRKGKTQQLEKKNPMYMRPFELGWKRELVYRANCDGPKKTTGDVYYYTPSGKKVRSMREISEIVAKSDELTTDNFVFIKEAVGVDDPEKEIIRDAKRPGGSKRFLNRIKSRVQSSRFSSSKTPKVTTGDLASDLKSLSKSSTKGLGFKIKAPSKKGKEPPKLDESIDTDDGSSKPSGSRKSARYINKETAKKTQMQKPCSIQCMGVQGSIPALQCRVCLCLYHHQCVGLPAALASMSMPSYVCKNCHLVDESSSMDLSPPILSPPAPILPKLQPIPGSESPDANIHFEMPKLTPRPLDNLPVIENKSLVGGVTTWLPHNSTIVDNIQRGLPEFGLMEEMRRPQYLEILAGRKFLVIPKHNFMSVSPSSSRKPSIDNTSRADETAVAEEKENVSPAKPESSHTDETTSTSDSPAKTKHLVKLPTTTGTSNETREDSRFMTNYLQNVAVGYATLKHVFQYLKVQDLLSAGCVCTMWRDIGSDPLLWRTIRMKNSQIHSFEGLAKSMKKYNTMHLDMRKMMLPSGGDEIWDQFATLIKDVDSLRKIEFCRCTAAVVEQMSISNPLLEVINATAIKCESMSLDSFAKLHNISELRLKSTQGMRLTSNIDALTNLKKLKHLSLTSVRDLNSMSLEVIGELLDLESLELGEFSDFPETFGKEILSKLVKLEKLRLEKGQGNCHTFEILSAVKDMTKIEQLELVNFDIKAGFDKALGACKHVRKLMIIPTYISQSATTNHMVLGGVLRLQKSLSHFVWGVTLELLRVTELFIDQCEEPEKKKEKKRAGAGDSIPVLKPVPLLNEDDEIASAHEPPQVEILSLPNLQKLLLQSLPTTRVKILKIPFHATWRQSITDSGN